ncbi:MAG TPA: BadF/BadG/BcrA/BcrD ATPase family protein [Aestuariivirgaceae bacterium]|nr:BadF/BadG/BcrA/BcrD ATPase family protein [Aestuariivirgaceae bacterium]
MKIPPALFIGIDGGGSRCRARIRDSAGRMLGEAEGGPSNIYQDLPTALATILATASKAAQAAGVLPEELHAGLGIAGFITSVAAESIAAADFPFASAVADNDAYAACIGAFAGANGGIVIAGTGSIGLALIDGKRLMVGGWGFALGDHGSGAWLGHHAVRRAALAIDGLLQPTPLIEALLKTVGQDRLHLTRWSSQAAPKDYARLAPLVFEAAVKGDVQAMTIVIEGAAAISNLGRALLARGAGRLCLLGGLAKVYPPYLDADVRASLALPVADAVDGAIMMARRARGLSERWE